jgi:lipopolysaccharide transport system ATP-binding protein
LYHAVEDVSDITFGIAIYSDRGNHIFGTNTRIRNVPLSVIRGDGHLDLRIEHIPMHSGKYLLSPSAQSLDYSTTYDWVDKQYSFEVIPTSGDEGTVAIPCGWVN